jgi:2-polyprenyl-3-methyl-5-hydroxy-6-metoxy-1,4-benzoquinol methylase
MTDIIRNRLNIINAVERILPEEEPQGIISIHFKRYEFAAQYCHGKKVLDAATGVGYGAEYLSKVAAHVVGIDIDAVAINYGKSKYHGNNLHFEVADAIQTTFPDCEFDVICSFETIEHLSDISSYLQEMVRLLNPLGVYIVSTPQVAKTNYHPDNPYHYIEFCRNDFDSLLKQYFGEVEIYGQQRRQSDLHYWLMTLADFIGIRLYWGKLRKIRKSVNKVLKTKTFEEMSLEDLLITKDNIKRASEIVAVCRYPKHLWNYA